MSKEGPDPWPVFVRELISQEVTIYVYSIPGTLKSEAEVIGRACDMINEERKRIRNEVRPTEIPGPWLMEATKEGPYSWPMLARELISQEVIIQVYSIPGTLKSEAEVIGRACDMINEERKRIRNEVSTYGDSRALE